MVNNILFTLVPSSNILLVHWIELSNVMVTKLMTKKRATFQATLCTWTAAIIFNF